MCTLFRRVKRQGHEGEELLSVYRDHGVVPKSSRDDNFNKPSDDLSAYQLVEDLAINKMKAWQGRLAAVASSLAALALVLPPAAMAADGYWLDQYNALLP